MNIIISGITCSGKTTLSNSINGTIMHEDDYMKDRNQIPRRKSYLLISFISLTTLVACNNGPAPIKVTYEELYAKSQEIEDHR